MSRNLLALGVTALVAVPASAQIVGDFDFQNLSADYQVTGADTGTFIVSADANSSGSVSNLIGGTDYALFDQGFAVTFGPAAFDLVLNLSNITGTSADASGTITISDIDGDTLTGTITGEWTLFGGVAFFTGDLSDVVFSNPGGSFSGGLSDIIAPGGVFFGAIQAMSVDPRLTQTFFGSDLQGVAVTAQAQFIPTPGAAALFGLGLGGLATRRRR